MWQLMSLIWLSWIHSRHLPSQCQSTSCHQSTSSPLAKLALHPRHHHLCQILTWCLSWHRCQSHQCPTWMHEGQWHSADSCYGCCCNHAPRLQVRPCPSKPAEDQFFESKVPEKFFLPKQKLKNAAMPGKSQARDECCIAENPKFSLEKNLQNVQIEEERYAEHSVRLWHIQRISFHCCVAQMPTIEKTWTCVVHANKRSSVPRRGSV